MGDVGSVAGCWGNASIRVKLRPVRPAMHPEGLAPLIVSQ